MNVFKHPKFYEEFRQRAKRAQREEKQKRQASSSKHHVSSTQRIKPQATSVKPQA